MLLCMTTSKTGLYQLKDGLWFSREADFGHFSDQFLQRSDPVHVHFYDYIRTKCYCILIEIRNEFFDLISERYIGGRTGVWTGQRTNNKQRSNSVKFYCILFFFVGIQ